MTETCFLVLSMMISKSSPLILKIIEMFDSYFATVHTLFYTLHHPLDLVSRQLAALQPVIQKRLYSRALLRWTQDAGGSKPNVAKH